MTTTNNSTNHKVTQYHTLVGAANNLLASVGPGSAGQVLQSGGSSANPAFSTPTYPSASGGAGKILRADGTNNVYSTATYPDTAGTSGNVLTSDGTNWISSANSGAFAPASVVNLSDDFISSVLNTSSSQIQGTMGWQCTGSNFFSIKTAAAASNPGLLANASAGGVAGIYSSFGSTGSSQPNFIIGGGAISLNWVFKINTLSNGTNRYTLYAGLGDNVSNGNMTNGVYFTYVDNANSGNWVGNTASASSRSTANSAVAASSSAYVNLGITINAAGSSASFFVNGTQIANSPIATNLPTVVVMPIFKIDTALGTQAAGTIYIDLFYMTINLTTPR